jgi:hypothetical protein
MFYRCKQVQAFVKIQAVKKLITTICAWAVYILYKANQPRCWVIASAVKGSGKYDYKVKEMSEKNMFYWFFQGSENIGNSTFTIEEA